MWAALRPSEVLDLRWYDFFVCLIEIVAVGGVVNFNGGHYQSLSDWVARLNGGSTS